MSNRRIVSIGSELLQLPLARPIVSGSSRGGPLASIFMLVVRMATNHGPEGLGFAYFLQGGGRAARAIVEEDLAGALLGEDPLDHERLWQKLHPRFAWVPGGCSRWGVEAWWCRRSQRWTWRSGT